MASRLQALKALSVTHESEHTTAKLRSSESENSSDDENDSDNGENGPEDNEEGVEEEEDDDDENMQETCVASSSNDSTLNFTCEALCDFSGEEVGDLSFQKGSFLTIVSLRQDGWWEAENQIGQKGMVPSTFLKVPDKLSSYIDELQATPSASLHGQLWEKLQKSVKQSHNVEQALTALGAFPLGFCEPTLSQLIKRDPRYTTEAFLAPKLSSSGLSFRDLHWSPNTKSLKPVVTRLQRAIRLIAFRQVHPPGSGYEVTSRHVRICLHDGSKVLSNIHTIRAKWDPKVPKIWTFQPKISSGGCCLEEGQFFLRSDTSSATIGVVFQLSVSYKKLGTNESGEMSCGWVFMRLLDDSGIPVPNKTKILRIHSGVPFLSQGGSPSGNKVGVLKHFINRGKQPRLVVSIATFKRKTDQLLNFLPMTLIGSISSIPMLALYRKMLCDKLIRDRTVFDSTELIQSPFLKNFPKVMNHHDILDVFRKLWSDKLKKMKQSVLKDEENKKMAFQQLFMETGFLFLQCGNLPEYWVGNMQNEEERRTQIVRMMNLVKENGPLAIALSPDYKFHPISIDTLSLDIIGPFCMPVEGIE